MAHQNPGKLDVRMTFNPKKDKVKGKTTFDGRQPFMEDDLRGKTILNGRQPWMEDDLFFRNSETYKTTSKR